MEKTRIDKLDEYMHRDCYKLSAVELKEFNDLVAERKAELIAIMDRRISALKK